MATAIRACSKPSCFYPSQEKDEGLSLLLAKCPTQGSYLSLLFIPESTLAGRIKSHVIEVASWECGEAQDDQLVPADGGISNPQSPAAVHLPTI